MKLNFTLLCICIVCTCCSQSKESKIEDFRKMVTEVEEKGSEITEEEWKNYEKIYGEMTESLKEDYMEQMTDDEKKQINLLQGIFLGKKLKHDAETTKENTKK